MKRKKLGKGLVCIDVDLEDDLNLTKTFNVLRALYEYNFIARDVRVTEHGLHVYIDVDYPPDEELAFYIRRRYGDDERRIEWDMSRNVVNICFNSTERYRTKPHAIDHIVFRHPAFWGGLNGQRGERP